MTLEKTYYDAMKHLKQCELEMAKLHFNCPDWTASELIKIEFRHLKENLDHFAKYNLGIGCEKQSGK